MTTLKKYTPPRSTRKATYWYIPTTPTVTGPPKGAKQSQKGVFRESGAEAQPRGTYIYNPTFPDRSIQAQDVAVHQRPPYSNPTEGGGLVTAATAAQLIGDSGPLAAGTYYVEVIMGASGAAAAGKHLSAEHRNAANAATLFTRSICPYGGSIVTVFERVVVALNERIRVIQSSVVGAAAEVAHATIRVYLLPI